MGSTVLLPIVTLLFIMSSQRSAYGADSTTTVFETVGSDIAICWSDLGPYYTRPLHFEGNDWRNTGLIIGGVGSTYLLDNSVRSTVQKNTSSASVGDIMNLSRQYGESLTGAVITSGVYLGGLVSGDESIRKTGRELIETILLSAATTTILKVVVGRSRPYLEEGNHTFRPISFKNDNNSFPSGHTTIAFSISSVLASRIDNPVASILLYGLAASTAYSRIYHDQHWFSDTFFAAALATTTGWWVVHRDEERERGAQQTGNNFEISPTLGGLSVTYRF